jgi:hypothetical protein
MPEPDRTFMRDLRNMDRRLGVKFNGNHFVVTYKRPVGEPVNIYRVKADDGSFRQPDKRDLMVIKGGDLAEGDSMDVRLKKTAYASELIRREEKRKVQDEIKAMTRDGRRQLINAFKGETKGNATFRRIAQ